MAGYFITGTDTGVGKTCVALALMNKLKQQGKIVGGMKPVSAGCTHTEKGLRNNDAVQLQNESSIAIPYEIVNPYAYEPPIAPHIAAQQVDEYIAIEQVTKCYQQIDNETDVTIVEGAGGWLVPINDSENMADIAVRLQLPVILVVGVRLGCLNHALLSVASIKASGLTLAGWVGNLISEDMPASQNNIDSLKNFIPAPLLGVIPYQSTATPEKIANYIDLAVLTN